MTIIVAEITIMTILMVWSSVIFGVAVVVCMMGDVVVVELAISQEENTGQRD